MLVFGLIAIRSLFTWLAGEDVSEAVEEIINPAFSVSGKVCIVHFILTILATLFFEKTEEGTWKLQIFETILILGLWLFASLAHSCKNSK